MYWQVYLHKTVVSAEQMLVNLLRRASDLVSSGQVVKSSGAFACFLNNEVTAADFRSADKSRRKIALDRFAGLDDSDVTSTIKEWINHADPVLADLSDRIVNRKLMKIKISNHPFSESQLSELHEKVISKIGIPPDKVDYFVSVGEMTNKAYKSDEEAIMVLFKNGKLKNIGEASDINLEGLTKTVRKHFVCYPAKIYLGN
jgi:HD superfamily phosphohydrolase